MTGYAVAVDPGVWLAADPKDHGNFARDPNGEISLTANPTNAAVFWRRIDSIFYLEVARRCLSCGATVEVVS